jgi:hypothetical protein
MRRKLTTGERWNRAHPEKVRAAQLRYYLAQKERRSKLSRYMRAKEDAAKILETLKPHERKRLLKWAFEQFAG